MKNLIFILLLSASCQKSILTPSGTWTGINRDVVATIEFQSANKYSIESYYIKGNIKYQSCLTYGTYSSRPSGLGLRIDGQNFDWATHGKIQNGILILKDPFHNTKLIFSKQ